VLVDAGVVNDVIDSPELRRGLPDESLGSVVLADVGLHCDGVAVRALLYLLDDFHGGIPVVDVVDDDIVPVLGGPQCRRTTNSP
jgi:hypothetical protein